MAQSGEDGAQRGSRDRPYRNVGFAVSQTHGASESNRYAVLVATGMYVVRDLQLPSWVDLYGGFDEENWNRRVAANKTVLDARGKRRLLVGADRSRVDGFTLTGGRCRGHGGAILCEDAGMVIRNNVFIDNGTLEPTGYNRQHLHQRAHTGGAIAVNFASTCEITHNLFVKNFTEIGDGGAISCYDVDRSPRGKCVIEANVFLENHAGIVVISPPWTRSSNGGAIACSSDSSPNILKNVFVGNQVGDNSDGGAIYAELASSPLIQSNWIVGNRGYDDGGSIYCMRDSQPTIASNWIAGNSCVRGGPGGIRLSKEGRAVIRNNFVVHNQSGGGVISASSWMRLENNTIVHNQPNGVEHLNSFEHFAPSVLFRNIIRGNGLHVQKGGLRPTVSHNNIEGGFDGEGNIDADPHFMEDGIEGRVSGIRYDPDSLSTWITCVRTSAGNEDLTGRVIQYGDRWSVVNAGHRKRIAVWGDLTRKLDGDDNVSKSFRIIPTYQRQEHSHHGEIGAIRMIRTK